jgi:hypothetical protein
MFNGAIKVRSYFFYCYLFDIEEASTDVEELAFHHGLLLGVTNWPAFPEWHRQQLEEVRSVLHF